ncbi:Thioredoxin-like superfamily [Arabidopsis suecica]|uniref:Thioredoxin-like superfamily n=1 Tax=Arabidopsis suecica TaxID=45249 RepID=A0A8T2DK35_ARASU|nr:Thioredoxin-like superfamily [Arabidopsis suecica]
MATRGSVAAAASTIWKHRRNPSLRSLSRHFNPNFNHRIIPTGFKYQVRAIQGTSTDPVVTPLKNREEPKPQNWKIKMLYDGDCPLCMREVNMLMERNEKHGTIKFVDISSNDYSPEDNQGLDYKTVNLLSFNLVQFCFIFCLMFELSDLIEIFIRHLGDCMKKLGLDGFTLSPNLNQ